MTDLQRELYPLENAERWGPAIARCEAFLAAWPAPAERNVVDGWVAHYREELDRRWFEARSKATASLERARDLALAGDIREPDLDAAIADVSRPLDDLAAAHAPALDNAIAEARAALAPRFEAVRRFAGASRLRAAVGERVWPHLFRRDYPAASAEIERLGKEFPKLEAEVALEREDLSRLERCFADAVEGARLRIGAEESLKLRGSGWMGGTVVDASNGRLTLLAGGERRTVAVLDLDVETIVRLCEVIPPGPDRARRAPASGLLYLADGDARKARAWFEKAASLGEDVSRYLGKLE